MTNTTSTPTDMQVLNSLKSVIDPELMVNIVDLGMIYNITIDSSTNLIEVEMTLTSKGCPLGDVIMQHATEVLKAQYPNYSSLINLVWEPAWNPSFITAQGNKELE
ncbi:MAG TPA: metal-sulfur cluster assembly factor [Flavobacteriaceae bacterium]|nr:metal-sulfur cluster assembly factor [Flavobacteriaceae bacterium]HEX5743430.1 metal-sulfur cluster assembly factor [Flavobacteriaceae bacterium]